MAVKRTNSNVSRSKSKKIVGLTAVIVMLIAIVAGLEITNTTHFFHKAPAVSGKIPVIATGKTATNPPKNTTSTTKTPDAAPTPAATSQPSVKSSAGAQNTGQSSSTLQAPFGSFVSNHSPNLGGKPAPSQEQSVCNTTPGATCGLSFTNSDGVVKTLPAQTADSNGNATWLWDVNTAGFTAGDWKIIATVSLSGQSKSSSDQLPLKVQP